MITGCADDDPAGISTYSVAGASLGYAPLWTVLFTFPLMTAMQLMSGRLGLVTGRGFAAVIRTRYSRWILWGACSLLIIANVINIAADLGGMGAAAAMVTGVTPYFWTALFAVAIVCFLFWSSYRQIARVLKWTTIALLAYVITAFLVDVDWRAAAVATFVPHLSWSREWIAVLVAILGTTISPYLFFWQAAEEVEERSTRSTSRVPASELRRLRVDVVLGMLASNLIMYFIILTTAATLHAHGKTEIHTAREAAEALRPLGGNAASWLFALGLIGTGGLGVPVLAGSSAYALSEAAAWRRRSLERTPGRAPQFYAVLAAAMLGGLALNYFGWNPVKMLFWSAVVNGALAPPLILLLVLLTSDRRVMGNRVNSTTLKILGWTTFAVMSAAAVALLVA